MRMSQHCIKIVPCICYLDVDILKLLLDLSVCVLE